MTYLLCLYFIFTKLEKYNIYHQYHQQNKGNSMKRIDYVLILLLILFGATNTIFLSMQNVQITRYDNKFFHPFIQTCLMFLGESFSIFLYLCRRMKPKQIVFQKPKAPLILLLIPGLIDVLGSGLSYVALNLVISSVWQISKGGVIVTTGLFMRIFLRKKFTKSMIIGCFLAILGITGVQLVSILSKSGGGQSQSVLLQIIGLLLILGSIIFNGIQFCYQKWLFDRFELSPLKLVGVQGIVGIIGMGVVTFILQFVSCPWQNHSGCVQVGTEFYLQSFSQYFYEIGSNFFLLLMNIGLVLSIAISVPLAVIITKRISPVSRSLADVTRTSLIWGFGLAITLTIGLNDKRYVIEDTDILNNILKGIGFTICILGTLIYHNIIPIQKDTLKDSVLLSDISFESGQPPLQQSRKTSRENLI